jgi:hypothetical protein
MRVYLPLFNAHSRVDLLYEAESGELRRVQCKTAHIEDNTVSFWTCSNTGGVRRTYYDDADDFGVYCPANEAVYLVPVNEVPPRNARLRLAPPRSNQTQGIRWAASYLIGEQRT